VTTDLQVILGAILFNVHVVDRQVIFEEACPIYSMHCRFTLERPVDINDTGGVWQFVDMDCSLDRISMARLVQAYRWVCEQFGGDFEPYKGALSLGGKAK
jgi:hypothetical protein